MKLIKTKFYALVLLLVGTPGGFSQSFVNLDFEAATIAPTPVDGWTYPADPTQCFPGWTVGGSGIAVMYNTVSTGASAAILIGPNFPNALNTTPLQGSYSVWLQFDGAPTGPATLNQTGLIPAGTQSIEFLVGNGETNAAVTLNGVNIPLIQISTNKMAGNIAAFAGNVAQLTFSTTTSANGNYGNFYFDNVQFSTSGVPEPSELALAALGTFLLSFRCRRK